MTFKNAATIATRVGIESDTQHGAVIPPIHLSSTFSFKGFKDKRTYDYTRSGNPTRDLAAQAIAELEGGHGAVVTATGMAAITLVLNTLKLGDKVVACHDCYGGTYRLLNHLHNQGFLRCQFVDFSDEEALQAALAENPRLCWIETPSNPLLRLVDIKKVSELCGDDTQVVVDNTFLTPIGQRPIDLGADIVVHSTTKYINGHSDVVGGAVVAKNQELHESLAWMANCLGVTGAPFDSYLTLRGIRTLPLRFKKHCENARIIAQYLSEHPAVDRVFYPGLSNHPNHKLANEQQQTYGAMLSFELKDHLSIEKFVSVLELFSLAESLGGVESLIAHPASMTHAAMDPEARKTAGISDRLLRISVGIEEVVDLIRDLDRGLQELSQKPWDKPTAERLG